MKLTTQRMIELFAAVQTSLRHDHYNIDCMASKFRPQIFYQNVLNCFIQRGLSMF